MEIFSGSKEAQSGSGLMTALMPNAAYVRLWRLVAGIFLLVGVAGLFERVWVLTADLHARYTWPVADGQIISAKQQDDSETPGRMRGHTRYWVEYEVRFAVPAERCRTGMIYGDSSGPMPCYGVVQTRSTQSTAEVYDWYLHGFHVNEPVKVFWNPEGTASNEIKIADEPIWLRYNFGRLIFNTIWVIGFGSLYVFCRKQLAYFANHGRGGRTGLQPLVPLDSAGENSQLTDLDLS